jgi:ADP-L-glycero-D-manno-heptose 6-epimerase
MNIVTGYRGFIGSHLYRALNDPYGIDHKKCFSFLNKFTLWDSVQCVYHMGGISDTTETDVSKIYRYNIDFTIKLFEKCIEYGIPVKYASSASVYGNTNHKINPLNYYAMSKATIDYWVQLNQDRFKFIQGFRFFNVYGNNEEHKGSQASPVTQFKIQAQTTGKIKIFEESNNCIRDFVCVEDVCKLILHNNHVSGIYDLGTSKPISFLKVAELIQKKYGGEIVEIPFPRHLKEKYQFYTCANSDFDYKFKSLEEWLYS